MRWLPRSRSRLKNGAFVMDMQATLNTYADLMTQIKSRQNILMHVCDNSSGYPEWAVAEFAQLQIRLICETFALGCLVAHGDVPGTQSGKLSDAYRADFIMKALEKLHPYFYPRPTKQVVTGGKVTGWDESTDAFLTKDTLIKSYNNADGFLHMGDLNDLRAGKQKRLDRASIIDWSNKVVGLLNHHNIYLADAPDPNQQPKLGKDGIPVPKRQIVALMQASAGGVVQTALFTRWDNFPGPAPS
jgi:hypothetical protein